jgi:hypothetical protein
LFAVAGKVIVFVRLVVSTPADSRTYSSIAVYPGKIEAVSHFWKWIRGLPGSLE